MKPEWFRCEHCLWADESEDNDKDYITCRHTSQPGEDSALFRNDFFCQNWTCARCWQGWDYWNHAVGVHKWLFRDHTKCAPVRFEGEE